MVARYQSEGFGWIYIACTGTNTQKFIDLLESMFGDVNIDGLDPQQLETKSIQTMREEASQAEEASVSKEHGPISGDKVTRITVTTTPVPIEHGIPELSIPESKNVKYPSVTNPAKKLTRFYYHCKHCAKSSQNKVSMMNHTRCSLNIKLICGGCNKEYDSVASIEEHINEIHRGMLRWPSEILFIFFKPDRKNKKCYI